MKRRRRPIPAARFRRPAPGHETLERLLRWPALRRGLLDAVHLWSGEHLAYWRENGCGYTDGPKGRGTWTIDEALKLVRHCGPEKQIELHSLF